MKIYIFLIPILVLPILSFAQSQGIFLLPEVGLSVPNSDFKASKLLSKTGFQTGLHIDKKWKNIGLGMYAGFNSSGMQYDYQLPASTNSLSIERLQNIKRDRLNQLLIGIGPLASFRLTEKIGIDLSSKFGFSGIFRPEFEEKIKVGTTPIEEYTLYRTNSADAGQKINPMLMSAIRIHYKVSDKMTLFLSGNFNHIWNVKHSYTFLDGAFYPSMSSEALIETLSDAPSVSETRRCNFNSSGASLGISYNLSKPKEKPKKEIPDDEINPDSCLSSLIKNDGFTKRRGRAFIPTHWSAGYGSPKFLNSAGEGFFDPGYVELSGNQYTGSSVTQTLDISNKFIVGRHYVVNIGVKFQKTLNTLDYAKVRAIAYNGTLPSNGAHPSPDQNIAIIGRSGKIKDCGDWSMIELPVWTANKNFDKISINAFTNDGTSAVIWIDNVSVCEVSEGYDCDSIQLDASGKPVIPAGYGNVPPGFACYPEAEEEEYYNGTLQDLYGQLYGYDGTTNWYATATEPCFSIGGTLPDEVLNYNCDDSLKMAGINMTCEEFQKLLAKPDLDKYDQQKITFLPPIGILSDTCKATLPNDFGNMAFGGKDIIYIHGLELGHITDRLQVKHGAMADWPDYPKEFDGGGYYNQTANVTWGNHIYYFTTAQNYQNRYLVVSYNCSQRLEFAVHAVLSQIREAMEYGTNINVPNPDDPRGKRCFGREYVIISQSTGAIISDVALAISNNTKSDPALAAQYGHIGLIADRCSGHIARRGAFTGSDLATMLVTLGNLSSPAYAIATSHLADPLSWPVGSSGNGPVIEKSILVDLIPSITRSKWGPLIDQVNVPVLTIAGGHPTFFSKNDLSLTNLSVLLNIPPPLVQAAAVSMKNFVHPGYDDGVITMDCATGRKSTYGTPSYMIPSSKAKLFDMGIPMARAVSYFIDQRLLNDPSKFGIASTPYLSPTGMVQPVSSFSLNPSYNNHFPFIQAASEHSKKILLLVVAIIQLHLMAVPIARSNLL